MNFSPCCAGIHTIGVRALKSRIALASAQGQAAPGPCAKAPLPGGEIRAAATSTRGSDDDGIQAEAAKRRGRDGGRRSTDGVGVDVEAGRDQMGNIVILILVVITVTGNAIIGRFSGGSLKKGLGM